MTAIIPDNIVKDVKEFTGAKNTTESLIQALNDWLYQKRLQKLNETLKKDPVEFKKGFDAESVRQLNNRRDLS
ncbi:MAG: hypothetical protein RIC80_16570 [Cyclobacteriaceae bacterium]